MPSREHIRLGLDLLPVVPKAFLAMLAAATAYPEDVFLLRSEAWLPGANALSLAKVPH